MTKHSDVPARDVSMQRDGKTYTGSYRVERGVVHVRYGQDSKATQIGHLEVEQVAKHLLAELVGERFRSEL